MWVIIVEFGQWITPPHILVMRPWETWDLVLGNMCPYTYKCSLFPDKRAFFSFFSFVFIEIVKTFVVELVHLKGVCFFQKPRWLMKLSESDLNYLTNKCNASKTKPKKMYEENVLEIFQILFLFELISLFMVSKQTECRRNSNNCTVSNLTLCAPPPIVWQELSFRNTIEVFIG